MPKAKRWLVCYRVKYSERWCADETSWVEHDGVVEAATAAKARRRYGRELNLSYRRIIIGRHISTRRV